MIKIYCSQKSIKLLFAFILTSILISCVPLKQSPKSLVSEQTNSIIDFFVNDTVTQYYIKPIEFLSKEPGVVLIADFTLRSGNFSEDVDVKFTLISRENFNFHEFGSFFFGNIELLNSQVMFKENNKKIHKLRISGTLSKDKLAKLDFESSWLTHYKINEIKFIPTRKAKKVLSNINSAWIY